MEPFKMHIKHSKFTNEEFKKINPSYMNLKYRAKIAEVNTPPTKITEKC